MSHQRIRPWALVVALLVSPWTGATLPQPTSDPVQDAERLAAVSYEDALRVSDSAPSATPTANDDDAKRYHEFRMAQQHDKVLFAALLGVVALLAHFVVLRSLPHNDHNSANIVSATGLIYIVFGTIILVVIATTEAQLTASMGILGAVAGYLFGKHHSEPDQSQKPASAE
jgi:hypothetical protein